MTRVKVSATAFQNQVGRYIDAAQTQPVTVTSHGRDKVVLVSPELFRSLTEARAENPAPTYKLRQDFTAPGGPHRLADPAAIALSIVNTSTPVTINRRELRDAIRNPRTKYKAQAHLLLNEVSTSVLAGLVAEKFASWLDLANLTKRTGTADSEKKAFIRRMAGLPLE